MQIHELKRNHKFKSKKRIARGGKRGKTSGRGQKGQKSRSGHRIKHAEMLLLQRIPKLRGAGNLYKAIKSQIVKLSDLKKLKDLEVNPQTLKNSRLIKNAS